MSEFFGKRSVAEDPTEAVLELARRVDELEQTVTVLLDSKLVDQYYFTDVSGIIPRAGIKWDGAGADEGPYIVVWRNSPSPAADDKGGGVIFGGQNSVGDYLNYAKWILRIIDPTDASEDARIELSVVSGGTLTGVVGFNPSEGITLLGTGARIIPGTGSPEGVVSAPVSSLFLRSDGGAGTCQYVKESGTGNTGWVPK